MKKLPPRAENLRRALAQEAARIMSEHGIRDFLTGRAHQDSGAADVVWMRPDGPAMTDDDWARADARALGVFLNGAEVEPGTADTAGGGDSFLVLFNAHHEGVEFTLDPELGEDWHVELCTDSDTDAGAAGPTVTLPGRSLRVLRRTG